MNSILGEIRLQLPNIVNEINKLNENEYVSFEYKEDAFHFYGSCLYEGAEKPWLCDWDLRYIEQTFCDNFELNKSYYFERINNKLVVGVFNENTKENEILYDGRKYDV